jgi:O-antigen/teichoic acid export membrane protein
LSSADLGSYNTAMILSQSVLNLAAPIVGTLSPLIISLHNSRSYSEIERLFSKYTMIFNLIAGIILALFIFHGDFFIGFWIGENEIKKSILKIILYLLASSVLILNQMLPYQVSIASLNFKKVVIFGFLNIIITIPLYYFGVKYGGIRGVAMVWFFSNLYLTIINNYLYLSPIYIELYKKMLFQITLLPILASFFLFAIFEQFIPEFSNQYLQFFAISTVAMFALLGSAMLFRKKIYN